MTETRSRLLILLWGGAVFVAVSTLRWGIICFNPWTNLFATSPVYAHYADYFPEGTWDCPRPLRVYTSCASYTVTCQFIGCNSR